MKLKTKLTSIALSSVLLLASACASNVSTNAQNANTLAQANQQTTPVKVDKTAEVTETLANNDRVFFATNSATISDEAYEVIQTVAPTLASAEGTKYVIEGHADERGTRAYNLALGKKRANALKQALVSNNIYANDIKTVTYGKDRPFNSGHNAQAWSENRRAVIVANTSETK